jgi:hypothetical protein
MMGMMTITVVIMPQPILLRKVQVVGKVSILVAGARVVVGQHIRSLQT